MPFVLFVFTFIVFVAGLSEIPHIQEILNVVIGSVTYYGVLLLIMFHLVNQLDLPPNEMPYPHYSEAFLDFVPESAKVQANPIVIANPPLKPAPTFTDIATATVAVNPKGFLPPTPPHQPKKRKLP